MVNIKKQSDGSRCLTLCTIFLGRKALFGKGFCFKKDRGESFLFCKRALFVKVSCCRKDRGFFSLWCKKPYLFLVSFFWQKRHMWEGFLKPKNTEEIGLFGAKKDRRNYFFVTKLPFCEGFKSNHNLLHPTRTHANARHAVKIHLLTCIDMEFMRRLDLSILALLEQTCVYSLHLATWDTYTSQIDKANLLLRK